MESSLIQQVTIVTFADFGSRENLKTRAIKPLIDELSKHGLLSKVICRLRVGKTDFHETVPAISITLHYVLSSFGRVFPWVSLRRMEEALFDILAARKLPTDPQIVLFHPGRFRRTIKRAQSLGHTTVGFGTAGHPKFVRGLYEEEYTRFGLSENTIPRVGMKDLEAIQTFDYIIALSAFVKHTYIESGYPAGRIFTVSLDVDTERFSPREEDLQDPTFTVLFPAASIGLLRGLQYLMTAWERFSPPDVRLVIMGTLEDLPAPVRKDISEQIEKDGRVKLAGFSSMPEKEMCRSDVVVLPSLTEGFPKVILEAMACGTPVITTENARGFVEDEVTGFVMPIRNSDAILDKLQVLYEDRSKCWAMGHTARTKVLAKEPFGTSVLRVLESITNS